MPQNFWHFSLDLYDREGVANACLALQDDYQLDVNLILFCFWYGTTHGVVTEKLLGEVIDFSAEWRQQVVQPLRDTRRWMKLHSRQPAPITARFGTLRQQIKASELAAEKIQQERIALLSADSEPLDQRYRGKAASEQNLDRLMQALRLARDEKLSAAFAIVANALE